MAPRASPVYFRAMTSGRPPGRVLIIKPSSLGDIVHALPILSAFRKCAPQAHIAWLVANPFAELLEGHPALDEVIRFDRARFGRMWRDPLVFVDFWRFVGEIRRRRFDLVVDLQGLIRSGLIARFSGARQRVGFRDAREGAVLFYTRRVRPPKHAHAVEKILTLGREMGWPVDPPAFSLGITEQERAAAQALLDEAAGRHVSRFTAVVPGARWASKQWLPERHAAVIDALHAQSETVVLLGAPNERPLAERILRDVRGPVVDLVGRTRLRGVAALLSLAQRVFCQDSGPMHIAAALGRPVVALFGPTNPARTGPYSIDAQVLQKDLPCSPCYRRECPLGHHNCMRLIEPAEAIAALKRPVTQA